MLAWWVAPATSVAVLCIVGRAEVGGGDKDGGVARQAPLRLVPALNLKAGTAAQPIIEQGRAECHCVGAISTVGSPWIMLVLLAHAAGGFRAYDA